MKNKIVFLLILPFVLASCSESPVIPTAEESQAAITEKINMANERWAGGDPMGFVDCAAQDITWMDDLMAPVPIKGREALKTYLEGFRGQIPAHTMELTNMDFQNYGDIVIVTYHYEGTFEGVSNPPWKVTSVYRYADNDWLSVHENWTVVEEPSE
jgi:hypothetical protein